jgi:hypothetical protein
MEHTDAFGNTNLDPFAGMFAKSHHVAIDLEDGAHKEEFKRLEAQRQVLQVQLVKYPLIGQALKEGWAEIHMRHGDLGFHFNRQRAISSIGDTAVDKNRDVVVGNHFSVEDHRKRHSFAKAALPIENGANLCDSVGF